MWMPFHKPVRACEEHANRHPQPWDFTAVTSADDIGLVRSDTVNE